MSQLQDTIAQEIWQRYAVEVGRALPEGMADKLAATVVDTLRLSEQAETIAVFVADDPPRMVWRGLEHGLARHAEFIPHTRLAAPWHSDDCPDCLAEPGVHDRRHAEILAATNSAAPHTSTQDDRE